MEKRTRERVSPRSLSSHHRFHPPFARDSRSGGVSDGEEVKKSCCTKSCREGTIPEPSYEPGYRVGKTGKERFERVNEKQNFFVHRHAIHRRRFGSGGSISQTRQQLDGSPEGGVVVVVVIVIVVVVVVVVIVAVVREFVTELWIPRIFSG